MTTPNHMVKSGLIVYPFVALVSPWFWILVAIAMYLGGRADFNKFFKGEKWNDYEGDYKKQHNYEEKSFGVKHKYLPFQNLHLWEDKIVHNPDPPYGWFWWAYIKEGVEDVILGLIIYRTFFV